MVKKLGQRLVDAGLVTARAVDQALQQQKITGHRLGDCLVEIGLLTELDLLRFLAAEFKTRFVSADKLAKAKIPSEVLDLVPVRMAEAQAVLPVAYDPETRTLTVVMGEPQNADLRREIALVADVEDIQAYLGLRSSIQAAIKKHYYGDPSAFALGARVDHGLPGSHGSNGSSAEGPSGVPIRLEPAARAFTSIGRQSSARRDSRGATWNSLTEADFLETLRILVGQLESGRKALKGHSAQLTRQCTQVAQRLGLPSREVTYVAIACELHDLGKPRDRHLTLIGQATGGEWKADAKRYSRAPVKMFESVNLPVQVNAILAQVHEAYDGSGVPQGARGEEIPAGARIIAAVDAYLDLTKNPANPLGRLLGKSEALGCLRAQAGKLFDSVVVDVIERLQSGEMLEQRLRSDGRQVLLADPDALVRSDLQEVLIRQQMVVHSVPTLDGVAEAMLAGSADLLVLGLPFGLEAVLELLTLLRQNATTAAVPIIVLGDPDPGTQERLLQAGASATLPLPLDIEGAGQLIRALFDDRIQNGAPARVVRGALDEMPLPEVLRTLADGKKHGRLSLRHEARQGFIQLEQGRVVLASWAGQSGEAALRELLRVDQGDFIYEPDALLMEMPQLDRELALLVPRR